jgi:hypothetical protein
MQPGSRWGNTGQHTRPQSPNMDLSKHKRWESKEYLKFVQTLPCADCKSEENVVAHHLKGRMAPFSGGMGYKASDMFTMPLCPEHHREMHDTYNLIDHQVYFIFSTLDEAMRKGVLEVDRDAVRKAIADAL